VPVHRIAAPGIGKSSIRSRRLPACRAV